MIQALCSLLRRASYRLGVTLLCLSAPTGCVAPLAIIPAAGIANLAYKSGTMTVELEGDGNPIQAFQTASVRSGGTIPTASTDFARAEFSNNDVMIEAQLLAQNRVRLRGSSLSYAGRTYELEDGITNTTQSVVDAMVSQGFDVVSSERNRAF